MVRAILSLNSIKTNIILSLYQDGSFTCICYHPAMMIKRDLSCSQELSNALLSNEESTYDSTKHQDEPHLYPNLAQAEGHHNPVFIQYTNTEPKKKVFWYPYSGQPNPNTQVGEGPRQSQPFEPNTQVTFSHFRNGQEGRVF